MAQNHQHAQTVGNDNVVLESSLYTRVDGHAGAVLQHETGAEVSPAPTTTFRDYTPPHRKRWNPEIPLCTVMGCKAYRSKKFDPLCSGHARQQGLMDDQVASPAVEEVDPDAIFD